MSTQISYTYIKGGLATGPLVRVDFKSVADDGKMTHYFVPLRPSEVRELIALMQRALAGV